jgi:hypothetical protein
MIPYRLKLRNLSQIAGRSTCFRSHSDFTWAPSSYTSRLGFCHRTYFKRRLNLQDPRNLEDGTDRLSRNVCKKLPLLAAWQLRRAQFPWLIIDIWNLRLAQVTRLQMLHPVTKYTDVLEFQKVTVPLSAR